MKTQVKTIYRCDHCNKLYLVKHACEKHEVICKKNPINSRPCFECIHLDMKKIMFDDENLWTGQVTEVHKDLFFCRNKETFLYSPKWEHKGFHYETEVYSDYENNPMPKECKEFNTSLLDLIL